MLRASSWVLGLSLLLATGGCRHRGPWAEPAPIPDAAAVELLVLGQPRDGAATRAVRDELDRTLATSRAQGRASIIAWLGSDLGHRGPDAGGRCPPPAPPSDSALAELGALVESAGASAWGLPGPDGLRCAREALPYRQPGLNYVVRIHSSGAVELASSCAGPVCTLTAPSDDTLVELALLELGPWHYPELASADELDVLIAQQTSLLAALAAAPRVPRVLLSSIPVDSAGVHGLGGRLQRTGYRYLPPPVQAALAEGLFVGAIGALERSLQVSADLSHAVHRNARTYLARPVFGVVSGAAGGASHTIPTSRGDALLPDIETEHPGFVRLLISPDEVQVRVHARVAGRWRETGISVALDPAPLPALRTPPTIQPCSSCDPLEGVTDRETWLPRGPRPR